MTVKTGQKPKSIYARGADDGLWLGIIFAGIFMMFVWSLKLPLLNIAGLTLMLYVPAYAWRRLRRTHVACHGITTVSSLWMQGIVMFACASLIFGAGALVYLRFADPDFIMRVLRMGQEYFAAAGTRESAAFADEIGAMIANGLVPRTSDFVLSWMWTCLLTGSILSLLLAMLVRIPRVPAPKADTNPDSGSIN